MTLSDSPSRSRGLEHDPGSKTQRLLGSWRPGLEAQLRYFSYRAILVAIVSRNSFVLVFMYRGRELNPNIFFSNFSGASGISRQNPGISRQKSLIPWVSRDIPNFLAPTPSRGRPPPHQKISGLKSLGLGSFFVLVM